MMKVGAVLAVGAGAQQMSWQEYKDTYSKNYNGAEDEERKQIWETNLKQYEEINKQELGFTLGMNQFTDMTNEQFKSLPIRGYVPSDQRGMAHLGVHVHEEGEVLATEIDWVKAGAVTPVKNQGQCGSCWSFSTTGGVEGAWQLASGKLESLAEQQLVDCSTKNAGCSGGRMELAFEFLGTVDVASESSYPYTAKQGTCKTSYSTAIPKGSVTGYKSVGLPFFGASTKDLKSALNKGPVSIAIEADQMVFQGYKTGIITTGCGTALDHGVLAVGYTDDYFLVKNSWGPSWGDNGYVRLSTKGNTCGILSDPSYPTVSASVQV